MVIDNNGNVSMNQNLTVAGIINANGSIVVASGQSLTNNGSLTNQGVISANGGITIPPSQSLSNSGTSTFNGTVSLNASTFVNNGLTISVGGLTLSTGQTLQMNSGAVLNTQLPCINLSGTWTSGIFSANTSATVVLPISAKDNNRSRGTFNYNDTNGVFTIPIQGLYLMTLICDQQFGSLLWRLEVVRNGTVIYTLNRDVQLWSIQYRFNSDDSLLFRYFNYSSSSQNISRALDFQITF